MIDAKSEVAIRKALTLVALGKEPADACLRVGRLLDVATRTWLDDQEIIIKGDRIAYVGPAGSYPGTYASHQHRPDLLAIPGLGEVHKHIESSHLTPEWEAALVLPRGNTWTCEASHEFSNVNGARTVEFWMTARRHGSPLKIFPLPGSAVPPTTYEHGGGWLGHDEQAGFMDESLMVAGLDEVMDWPAVWDANNGSHKRLWGMIEATFARRGVVEGHAAGIRDLAGINAFAAAGLPPDSADVVLMNPPFNDAKQHRASPDAARELAHVATSSTLEAWTHAARRMLRSGGVLTLIWRSDGLGDVLASLNKGFGSLVVLPVYGDPAKPAIRVIVRAIKGGRTPAAIHPGINLRDATGEPHPHIQQVLAGQATLLLASP